MAYPLSADAAYKAIKDEGVRVRGFGDWKKHNRAGHGLWGPVHGVMLHHTASAGTKSSVQLCRDGHTALPGPLCHGVIDKDGITHMVGWGRANHAGLGDGGVLRAVVRESKLSKPRFATVDGNARFYGFECINLGDNKDHWPEDQIEAMVRVSAALLRAHGWGVQGVTSVIGHEEWQVGKVDPRGPGFPGMDEIRLRVAERLGGKLVQK
ncbi:N-acetylmuramoyl-L-alanine amidase [Streptomyces sp. 5-10]|uniref:peptidoglycan recognition protein family protein n=1 Tax=Streptomyces sp. 5-10 TaxID=878925 RepID=UPI00168B1948|nr:N-acetylmuramoyl-L-alanine amidase [Streptomyces sp. 5-10]MBD3004551.1 N-acetylmuramoyl-L-alanine amidase [Streptomyces sp. 5-10]